MLNKLGVGNSVQVLLRNGQVGDRGGIGVGWECLRGPNWLLGEVVPQAILKRAWLLAVSGLVVKNDS
jgi:hypothetical protein